MVGVPLAILPAIHYRESALHPGWYSVTKKKVIKNGGGPFMLDLGGKGSEFSKRIRAYEIKTFKLYGGKGTAPRVSRSFKFAALVAAHELKSKKRCDGPWTYDCLADACWGYNGRASWGTIEENPYLWSDPARGTCLVSRYRNSKGKIICYKDKRPGVMVLYGEITEMQKMRTGLPR